MNTSSEKLYYKDSHIKNFTATVLECIPVVSDDSFLITLDQTAFFPEGGGQPADKGTLNNMNVIDVQEENGEIIHKLKKPISSGTQVTGEINWDLRFSFMQQHSGEHIVSGLIHKQFGYDNVGFHMGSDAVTMDFNGILTEVDLRKVELLANEAVYKDVPILQFYPSQDNLEIINYRSKKELSGQVRIIAIPFNQENQDISTLLSSKSQYYDICACCAPHMKTTGEIGIVKLISAMKYKGGTRVSMLCGFRALEDYNKKEQSSYKISSLLSSKIYETVAAVTRLKEENENYKGTILELHSQLFYYKAKEIPFGTENICNFEDNLPANQLRHYCNALLERCSCICGVFACIGNEQYKYIVASKTVDVIPIGKLINEKFNGRGGGSKEMVQGSLTGNEEEIRRFFEQMI